MAELDRPQIEQINNQKDGIPKELGIYAASFLCPDAKPLSANLSVLMSERPKGVYGDSAQAIVVVDTSTIAGGGPATWALNNQEFLTSLAQKNRVPFIKIAGGNGKPSFAANGLTGKFVEPTIILSYPENCTTSERFKITSELIEREFTELASRGIARLFVLSEGYGGFGPLACTIATKNINSRLKTDIKMNAVYQDNCVPDSDTPDWSIDAQNAFPQGRFFPGSYAGIPGQVSVFALGVFGTPVPTGAEQPRALSYPGLNYIETAYNFTPQYMERLRKFFENLTPNEARQMLSQTLNLPDASIPIVSSLGNGIYWQPQPWMTPAQQKDVIDGTRVIVESLIQTSRKQNTPIGLVIVEEAVEAIQKFNLPVVFDEGKLDKSNLIVIPRPEIRQDKLLALKKISRFEFGRSRGNNAVAESAVLGRPVVVVLMPDSNYMGVSQMDPFAASFGLPVFRPTTDQKQLASYIGKLISDQDFAKQLGEREKQVFMKNYIENNYFDVIRYLSGLTE